MYLLGGYSSISNSTFVSNIGGFGAAIFMQGVRLTVSDCDFRENDGMEGGVAHVKEDAQHNASVTFIGTRFEHNAASASPKGGGGTGGGIRATDWAEVHIMRSLLQSNTAETGGGMFVDGNATAHISSSMLVSNVAEKQGGAAHAAGKASVHVLNSSLISNAATIGAGMFAGVSARLMFVASNASSNNASVSGGGLGAAADAQLLVDSSVVVWNAAAVHGGGISVEGNAGVAALVNSSIQLNRAKWGAGMSFGAGQRLNANLKTGYFAHNLGMYNSEVSPAASETCQFLAAAACPVLQAS
ncbi:hypothetical protein OEZ85_012113 [Tetradesmus obliquus]|uniref:Right handed beta helix domain-containing protein n=1 Tax=Tetradesmus obliquus TaxID=3088 RepID=A0ABY8TX45_TETOB|nr:hypothetical protein OEZ85_012113 [Tetradesmus obliquus]